MSDKPPWWKINRPAPGRDDVQRLTGCPAYPTSGLLVGATVEWCRTSRGKLPACATCKWNKA